MSSSCKVIAVLFFVFTSTLAFPQSGGSRRRRHANCGENEYLSNNICCTNCPAGKYMNSPCTSTGQMGQCEECEDGTYTEHSNGLKRCLACKRCNSDQEVLRHCTATQNTECQCKKGKFCATDQACEVCKTCSRCAKDEVIVRNCTATTDTECKKTQSPSKSSASAMYGIIAVIGLVAVAVLFLAVIWCRRRHQSTDSQRNQPDGLKAGERHTEEKRNGQNRLSFNSLIPSRQPVRSKSSATTEDEYRELCESLRSSASSSQQSITIQQPFVSPAYPPHHASPAVPRTPNERDEQQFYKLVPVNGEESLRKCFEYIEELDCDYFKRFFRHLDISDNVIKSKEYLPYEDRIHDLLHIWVEKAGRDASLNDLLKALLDLNQRRTAENVKQNAIDHGHYKYES